MKDVHSDVLYTQMKGRGCRVISDDKLKEVTPNADTKECYYIVDAVCVTESEKHIPKPGADGSGKKNLSLEHEIFQEVSAFAEKAASKGDTRKWLELACCYFYEHSDILKILFRYRTDDDFVLFLNERFNEQYPNLINKGYFTDVDDDTRRKSSAFGYQTLSDIIPQDLPILKCN